MKNRPNKSTISKYIVEKVIKCVTYSMDQLVVKSKVSLGYELSDYDKSVVSDDFNSHIESGASKDLSKLLIESKYGLKYE